MPVSQAAVAAVFRQCAVFAAVALVHGTVQATAVRAGELAELPFEDLLNLQVSTASRFSQPLTEAPSTMSVVTAADIKAFGWRTLADALASMRGLHTGYDRNYTYLGARGFLRPGDYNTRFLLLLDGQRVNDALYDQATTGTEFPLDLDLVERIEFMHGPGSSVYGPNAFFGVINVITKAAHALPGPQVAVEAGSHGARRLRASYGMRTEGGAEWLLAASSWRERGADLYFPEFDAPGSNNGWATGLDHDRADRLFFKAGVGAWALSLTHSAREKGIPTASFSQAFNDPRSRTKDAYTLLDLGYRAELGPGTEFHAHLYWGQFRYDGSYVLDDPALTLNRDASSTAWWGSDARMTTTNLAGHKLVVGLEWQHDYRRNQTAFDADPHVSYLDSRTRGWRWGAYVHDEIMLMDGLLLNLGARYDRHSLTGGNLNPRIGLIASATPETTLKALYGTAFRAPNAYELYYDLPAAGGQKANPNLQPERVRSAELVVDHRFSRESRLAASVFRNSVTKLISHTEDPVDQLLMFENLDRAVARGLGAELQQAWSGGTRLRASVTVQRVHDAQSGVELINAPRRLLKLNWSTPVPGLPWRAGVEARYIGARKTLNGAVSSYWLTNLTLSSVQLAPGLGASLSVYNLFDRRYADPGAAEHVQDAIVQDGRSVRLRVSYAF